MVAVPILSGAVLRIVLGLAVDRFGAKKTGICAQLVVMAGLLCAWLVGLKDYQATLLLGMVLGFGGASFAVALPQAGRWYPPHMQGLVMGLAGAGNIGTVLDALARAAPGGGLWLARGFRLGAHPGGLVCSWPTPFSQGSPGDVQEETARRLLSACSRTRTRTGSASITRSRSADLWVWPAPTCSTSRASSV